MDQLIKTAIVILNWNGRHFLEKFLPSVIAHSTIPDTGIWVTDNGSSDESVDFIKKTYPQIKLVLLDKNYGFAEGYNKALAQIQAKYFLLLNSDIEVTAGWITPLVRILDTRPDVAAVMPKLRMYDNRDLFEYAGAAGGFLDKFGYPFCRGRIFQTVEKDTGQFDAEKEIFWATGACMLVRSDLFHLVGDFDGSFFAHMEEIDLCWRLKNCGYKILYTPESMVFHVGGGTLNKENPKKTYLNYRNNLFMLFKNLPEKRFLSKIIFRMILDGISAAKHLVLFQGRYFMAILKAHLSFYKNFPKLMRYRKANKHTLHYEKHPEMINKSIIYHSFFLKKRTFKEIVE
jgi:GT2 family glycosyltransferase